MRLTIKNHEPNEIWIWIEKNLKNELNLIQTSLKDFLYQKSDFS